MDPDSEDALLIFKVGPNSVAERALALRVIFCKNVRRLLLILRRIILAKLATVERWSFYTLRKLSQWLDPRAPHFVLAAVLCAAVLLRRQRLKSVKEVAAYQAKFWSNLMRTALTYDEWAYAASMVEKYQQSSRRQDDELYDEDLVRAKLEDLKQRRMRGDVDEIMFALRTDLLRNLGNMCNPELHKGRLQTPVLIQDYIAEVRLHLRAVCDADSAVFPLDEKLSFIHETRHAFGRTALLLSGGAALGAFHLGVVRTLIEHRLLPRVLSGASVGSIVCSFAATRTWTELQQFFDDPLPPIAFFESMGSIFATAHRLLTKGAMQEIGQLQRKMRLFIGDLTFQEAYDLSGRVLGIPVCSVRPNEPHRLLNYLTAPHVVIWSAVTASCAFPGLFEAQELMAKDRTGRLVPYHMPTEGLPEQETAAQKRKWRDGSLESDLPMKELREQFNVNHFIVSQANPHIAPLLRIKDVCRTVGGQWGAKLASMVEMETKHRCRQALALGWRMGGLAKLFAQEWEGDVTIVMPATLAQFAKLIQNPTPGELRKAVIQGRRCTWERLSAIQANCGIELMLDECAQDLNNRRKLLQHQHQAAKAMAAVARANAAACPTRSSVSPGGADASPCRDPTCCVWRANTVGRGSHGPLVTQQQMTSSWKRIPSWNRFARERSWGSLDEEGAAGQAADVGGGLVPGALLDQGSERSIHGGSSRWLQGAGIQGTYMGQGGAQHGNHSGDSDSDTEGAYLHSIQDGSTRRGSLLRSWTKAGGPLMSSPSASCMLQLHDAAVAASAPGKSAQMERSRASTAEQSLSQGSPGAASSAVDEGQTQGHVDPSTGRPGLEVAGMHQGGGQEQTPAQLQLLQASNTISFPVMNPRKVGMMQASGIPVPYMHPVGFASGAHGQWQMQQNSGAVGAGPGLASGLSFSRWAAPQMLRPGYGSLQQQAPGQHVPSGWPQYTMATSFQEQQHHSQPLPHSHQAAEAARFFANQGGGIPGESMENMGAQDGDGPTATHSAIHQLKASASASLLAGVGHGSQGQLAEDWRLGREGGGPVELQLPPPTTATGEADEEGLLFGLAMESSMHGNRSYSVPTGPHSPGPVSQLDAVHRHWWGPQAGEASPHATFGSGFSSSQQPGQHPLMGHHLSGARSGHGPETMLPGPREGLPGATSRDVAELQKHVADLVYDISDTPPSKDAEVGHALADGMQAESSVLSPRFQGAGTIPEVMADQTPQLGTEESPGSKSEQEIEVTRGSQESPVSENPGQGKAVAEAEQPAGEEGCNEPPADGSIPRPGSLKSPADIPSGTSAALSRTSSGADPSGAKLATLSSSPSRQIAKGQAKSARDTQNALRQDGRKKYWLMS